MPLPLPSLAPLFGYNERRMPPATLRMRSYRNTYGIFRGWVRAAKLCAPRTLIRVIIRTALFFRWLQLKGARLDKKFAGAGCSYFERRLAEFSKSNRQISAVQEKGVARPHPGCECTSYKQHVSSVTAHARARS